MTAQMIGSAGVSFYEIGNNQRVVMVTDQKSRESFYLHLPWIQNYKRNSVSREVPEGSNNWIRDNRETTTNQTYLWIENTK